MNAPRRQAVRYQGRCRARLARTIPSIG
jgi:hypothetical protein